MAPPEALPPVSTEDFSGLVLGSNIDEALSGDAVWTKTPPLGWTIDDSGVPGVGLSDQDGISEWAGWSFADKDWWIQAAEDQRRSEFTKGTDTIMIADGDEWSDATHAEGNLNTFLNWSIDVAALDGPLDLKFDSSWLPDAGTDSLGVESNQTAVITVSLDGGQPLEILRWDSDPNSATYHGENTNETIWIQLPSVQGASEMVIRFGYLNAANNWWWALDNLEIREGMDSSSHSSPGGLHYRRWCEFAEHDRAGEWWRSFPFGEQCGPDVCSQLC